MKFRCLVAGVFALVFVAANAFADHIVTTNERWGGVYTVDAYAVHVGGGQFDDLWYAVTGGDSPLDHVPQVPVEDPKSPCSCLGTNEPMPHGTSINIMTQDGHEQWVWTASDGNDRPEDFIEWWKHEGPGTHGYDIDELLAMYAGSYIGAGIAGAGGGSLAAATSGSAGRTTDLFFQNIMLSKVNTKNEKAEEAEGRIRAMDFGPVLRYEYVDFKNIGDGDITGTNLGFNWTYNNISAGVMIPYDYMTYDFDMTGNRIGTVLYGKYEYNLTNRLIISGSANFNYMHTDLNTRVKMDDHNINLFGGGAGIAATLDLDAFVPSFAFAYQYSDDDTDYVNDHQHLVKMGMNLGFRLGQNGTMNMYGVLNYDITDYDVDVSDDNTYFDIGFEGGYNFTDTWGVNAGFKSVQGIDDFTSYQVYLGSIFKF